MFFWQRLDYLKLLDIIQAYGLAIQSFLTLEIVENQYLKSIWVYLESSRLCANGIPFISRGDTCSQ